MSRQAAIPVVDLFAGPGGLGEGFSSLADSKEKRRFEIKLSIEKDEAAHRTLVLRALFRAFPTGHVPDCYYDYVKGRIPREALFADPAIAKQVQQALSEARCAELGKTPHQTIDRWISKAVGKAKEWVLIGGPPCQAYSLAGRSRLRPKDPKAFERDKRHFLYTEYLRIIRQFSPSVFVMENVKGILTSKHEGSNIFGRILADLSAPAERLAYEVRSFVIDDDNLDPIDYLIECEKFGVPQRRHRVVLFGVRSDLAKAALALSRQPGRFTLKPALREVNVRAALDGLPALRSRLSQENDSHEAWLSTLKKAPQSLKLWRAPLRTDIEAAMTTAASVARVHSSPGCTFDNTPVRHGPAMPEALRRWVHDPKLGGVLQHQTRRHMRMDLHRYIFAACFAASQGYTPKLKLFPPKLLPNHQNMKAKSIPFMDRFRVQLAHYPSTTVVSHMAKDGHYYIHPDASQCRSLTVREAARLQTFPDNYFFEGTQTQQYSQVGNAVPPLLAYQIAEVVMDFLHESRR